MLRARLGDDVFTTWFNTLELDIQDGKQVRFSVPQKFLRNWIQSHYADDLLACARMAYPGIERVDVVLREVGGNVFRHPAVPAAALRDMPGDLPGSMAAEGLNRLPPPRIQPSSAGFARTQAGGFEGSPLDPRYTFDSFVVGPANRLAHAGATQVAETIMSDVRAVNPLFIHASVGLGKTHLLQAIAWDVKRRFPSAQVLYLTAERFRYQFVEALRGPDPMAFKDKFRQISMLLIDDLEFLHGEKTELEFDHIINTLLDGGKQLVVASSRAPSQIDKLNERMRSRLQRGLVTELINPDHDLRLQILDRRMAERQAADPSFTLSRDVVELLADRLTENGRELEGAITRLHHTWHHTRATITLDMVETVIRDLVQGAEPRRIKIEDIMRIVSRHFGVSKGDLISQRRHRSVVWPRQIGMYLAKQLTSRSLPEIGRRFGGRDHTTVLHAIRKIEGKLNANARLREELDELKKLLAH